MTLHLPAVLLYMHASGLRHHLYQFLRIRQTNTLVPYPTYPHLASRIVYIVPVGSAEHEAGSTSHLCLVQYMTAVDKLILLAKRLRAYFPSDFGRNA